MSIEVGSIPGPTGEDQMSTLPPRRRGPGRRPKTHCIHGHSLHDAYTFPSGQRRCRPCHQRIAREWMRRHKSKGSPNAPTPAP